MEPGAETIPDQEFQYRRSMAEAGHARTTANRSSRAERRRQVASMHLARVAQREIARRLSISESAVSKDLKAIRGEWAKEARDNVGTATLRELATLDADEARFRAKMAASKDEEQQVRLYSLILKIMERRARLLGLDAPLKAQVSGPDGGPIEVQVNHDHLFKLFLADPRAADLGIELLQRLDDASPPAIAEAPAPREGAAGGAGEAGDERAVEAAPPSGSS